MRKIDKQKKLLRAAAQAVETKQALMESSMDDIIDMASMLVRAVKKGGTIYLAGNGGSAADCQHFAAELVVRLSGKFNRPSLPAVAMTADNALMTAAANDFGFEKVFARQVESLAGKKDILMLISTSGNSANLIRAAGVARRKGVSILALLGASGGRLRKLVDRAIIVPSSSVQRIQEEHTFIIHNLVRLMELDLFR